LDRPSSLSNFISFFLSLNFEQPAQYANPDPDPVIATAVPLRIFRGGIHQPVPAILKISCRRPCPVVSGFFFTKESTVSFEADWPAHGKVRLKL